MKFYRFLGQEGRITIPLEIREYLDLEDRDLLSFTVKDDAVIIRREDVCHNCAEGKEEAFEDFFDRLPVRPKIVGTSAHGTALIDEVDMTGPVALVIGNETFGLSRAWKEACDELALIPIYGAASSLNAGCAASICLYEAARQRGD